MTKLVAYNERMLDVACSDLYRTLKEKGSVSIEYGVPFKDKTRRQLGFFFGAIVDSVISFFEEQGIKYSVEEVKDNFYQAISPRKTITQFNGKQYEVWKHISEMSLEEMSEFIDKAIWLCDNARAFQGLILHPSIRYTFIRHITQDDIRELNTRSFQRHNPEYLSYVRKQACICCGRYNEVEAHHLKEAGYSGTAYKADDWQVIPLCTECHREYHIKGKEAFEEKMQWLLKYIDFPSFTAVCYNRWLTKGL